MRAVIPSRLGRVIKPFALLEFNGRKSGRRYRIPVGWHEVDGQRVVLCPAPWRENFRDGLSASISSRGVKYSMTGTLDADPEAVAAAVNTILAAGTKPRDIGMKIPPGHTFTSEDAIAMNRWLVRFRPSL